VVTWSVCVCRDHDAAKTAERIEMPFGLWTRVDQGSIIRWGIRLNLTCAAMQPFYRITLTTCLCSVAFCWGLVSGSASVIYVETETRARQNITAHISIVIQETVVNRFVKASTDAEILFT